MPGSRPSFYPSRRVPQAFPPSYLYTRLAPLVPALAANAVLAGVVELGVLPARMRAALRTRVEEDGAEILERSQRMFFDAPGLDTLLVRSVAASARKVTSIGRAYLRARIRLHADRDGRAATMLPLVPRRGYDSLMTSMLAVGTALGQFRGGEVHARAFFDSGVPAPDGPHLPLPEGHPTPAVRRFDAPTSLGDMAADIDDLYWVMAYGQAVKITRVGQGEARRWLVSLPGTDHMTGPSTPNPADTETNIREVLNVPSAMRIGTVQALHAAMRADGVPKDRWSREPVLICGHSQGGMVATALAAGDPGTVGVDVTAVLSLGTPSRRLRIRPDVTMLAVAHDQDVVPSIDGTPQRAPDQRVTIGRRLVRPRRGPLYYAHSSATYTETVRQAERKATVAPWGRAAETVAKLREFLPREGEPVRVLIFDVWQDLLEPTTRDTWNTYVEIDRPDWEPVDYAEEWEPNPLITLPEITLPDLNQVLPDLSQVVPNGTEAIDRLRGEWRAELAELPDLSVLQERANERAEEVGRSLASAAEELRGVVDSVLRRNGDGGGAGGRDRGTAGDAAAHPAPTGGPGETGPQDGTGVTGVSGAAGAPGAAGAVAGARAADVGPTDGHAVGEVAVDRGGVDGAAVDEGAADEHVGHRDPADRMPGEQDHGRDGGGDVAADEGSGDGGH